MTGQAAGIGAAMIARTGVPAAEVDVRELRAELRLQGAYLHDAGGAQSSATARRAGARR
jgi:hypothetical protein